MTLAKAEIRIPTHSPGVGVQIMIYNLQTILSGVQHQLELWYPDHSILSSPNHLSLYRLVQPSQDVLGFLLGIHLSQTSLSLQQFLLRWCPSQTSLTINQVPTVPQCPMVVSDRILSPNPVMYRWVPLKPDFWEHENQSSLLVIWLIYIKLYRKREKKIGKNFRLSRHLA